jgi:putative intracellular protease/amidase
MDRRRRIDEEDPTMTLRTPWLPMLLAATLLLLAACAPEGPAPVDVASGDAASGDVAAGDAEADSSETAGAEATTIDPTSVETVTAEGEILPPWLRLEPPPLPDDRRLNVGFLVIDGVYNTELTAPYDVFQHTIFHTEHAEPEHPGMEVFTVSPDGEPVTTFEGLVLVPHHSFDSAPPIDVLVVPSAEHNMDEDLENEELIRWVRETGERALFVVSLCDGAFVLAQAGLLDGRACTTFPGDQDRFAETFPELDLHRGVSFVHDGPALTSEGGAKSFDVAMYLVDHLYGEAAAKSIGGGLLIPWPPAPGTMTVHVVE